MEKEAYLRLIREFREGDVTLCKRVLDEALRHGKEASVRSWGSDSEKGPEQIRLVQISEKELSPQEAIQKLQEQNE